MPATTRGYPYPSGSDAPDGPGAFQDLADAVDADVAAVESAAATDADLTAHAADTTSVHGIDDTAAIPYTNLAKDGGGLGPGLFRATYSGSPASNTEIVFASESFDLAGWYDAATGRYTPLVKGIYEVFAELSPSAVITVDAYYRVDLHKNGSLYRGGMAAYQRGANSSPQTFVHDYVALNGTTDYVSVKNATDAGAVAVGGVIWGRLVERRS